MHGQRKIFKTFVVPSLLPIMEVDEKLCEIKRKLKFQLFDSCVILFSASKSLGLELYSI